MKKLLLIFLFVSGFFFGQDMKYAESLNNLSLEQIKETANDILSGYTTPQKYFSQYTNSQNNLVLVYYPIDISEADLKNDSRTLIACKLCNTIEFAKYFKGENKDLEIKGTETYSLWQVDGKYLDLFPWWQKHFATETTKEDLLEKSREKRYIEDRTKRINIRFVKNMDNWEIRNYR